jgi:hypothetical protein
VLPALSDRHPDHSAAHVLLRVALGRASIPAPRLLGFAVHGAAAPGDVVLELDAEARRIKHDAILAHTTQMQFSRRRFLAFADRDEHYLTIAARTDEEHPLGARRDGNALVVTIDLARFGAASVRRQALFVAFETAAGSERWLVRGAGRAFEVRDCARDVASAAAAVQRGEHTLALSLALPAATGALAQGYVKLARPQPGWRVFDRFGWQAMRC